MMSVLQGMFDVFVMEGSQLVQLSYFRHSSMELLVNSSDIL